MGLGRTLPLLPADWVRPIPSGYDARMPGYTPRVAGRIMGASRVFSYNNLLSRIDRGQYSSYNPATGVDSGIVRLGRFVVFVIFKLYIMSKLRFTVMGLGLGSMGLTY